MSIETFVRPINIECLGEIRYDRPEIDEWLRAEVVFAAAGAQEKRAHCSLASGWGTGTVVDVRGVAGV